MDYVELTISTTNEEQAEIIMAELADFPFESFECEPRADGATVLKGYIPQLKLSDHKAVIDNILASYGIANARYISIESQNWNALWESNFDPVEVDTRLLVRAPFHSPDSAFEREVVIMPKMSFGTGHHATTHMMSEWVIELAEQGYIADKEGLDMGSGTGLLAIVAAKEGATHVDAVDIDEWADENCRENIATNGVEGQVSAILGDVKAVAGSSYHFILANINRNILLADIGAYCKMLKEGGALVVSGFLEDDIESLKAAAQPLGLRYLKHKLRNGWASILMIKDARI